MAVLKNKIDFSVIFTVTRANPNGDPLNGNRPRENYDGYGEMSDVSIKRKIRNRLQDMGEKIFVQSDDRNSDGCGSLKIRAEKNEALNALGKKPNREEYARTACSEWFDVRAFGQVFALKGETKGTGLSIPIRGPVSIQMAQSVSPVDIRTNKITSSVNNNKNVFNGELDSNRMGDKHYVDFGLYVFHGSINVQLAEKTNFSEEDAEKIHRALETLFENDCSSARPEGSMEVRRVYWYKHDSKTPINSSAKVHRLLKVDLKEGIDRPRCFEDYEITLKPLEGLAPEIFKG